MQARMFAEPGAAVVLAGVVDGGAMSIGFHRMRTLLEQDYDASGARERRN